MSSNTKTIATCGRVNRVAVAVSLAVATTAPTSVFANGADFAVGMGMGMLGNAVGFALAQQGMYGGYPGQRYSYASPRRRHVRTLKQPIVAKRPIQHEVKIEQAVVKVPRDREEVIRTFFDCGSEAPTYGAKVDHGTVTSRRSTRFVCGDPDHAVTEFSYKSEPEATSPANVTYSRNGRPIQVDHVFFGDPAPLADRAPPSLSMHSGVETPVWRLWNCDPATWDVAVSAVASVGTATVKTATAAVCDRPDYPVKDVYVTMPPGFSGDATIVFKTADRAPVTLPLVVEKKQASSAPSKASASTPAVPVPASSKRNTCECFFTTADGSLVRWSEEAGKITIRYVEPAAEPKQQGVVADTVLFEGMSMPDGGTGGRAYDFKSGCKPAPYAVLGSGDGSKLTLWGLKPTWSGCVAKVELEGRTEPLPLLVLTPTKARPASSADISMSEIKAAVPPKPVPKASVQNSISHADEYFVSGVELAREIQ